LRKQSQLGKKSGATIKKQEGKWVKKPQQESGKVREMGMVHRRQNKNKFIIEISVKTARAERQEQEQEQPGQFRMALNSNGQNKQKALENGGKGGKAKCKMQKLKAMGEKSLRKEAHTN